MALREPFRPGEFEVGARLTARVAAGTMDEAYVRLIRDLEPKLETWLGLQGLRLVRFDSEHARGPDNEGT